MTCLDLAHLEQLYRKYASDLAAVRAAQRAYLRDKPFVDPQLDDHEAEITYLLVRDRRPTTVVEIGTFHGWSTTWLLHALCDNGVGHLYSYDIVDKALRSVPPELAAGRWTFTRGDVRTNLHTVPCDADYLFIDAAHSGRFARWYLDNLFPRVPGGTPVSVHDVFHRRRPLPFTEGAVILRWLAGRDIRYFTVAPAVAPDTFRQLDEIKRGLGIDEPVCTTRDNPMIFFELPRRDRGRGVRPSRPGPWRRWWRG